MVNKARSTSPMTIKVSSFMQTSYCVTTTLERLIMSISQIFLLKILPRKPSFFFFNLTDWHDESLSHNNLFTSKAHCFSLVMFTLLYSPWDSYKLCSMKKIFFWLKILSRKPSFYFLLWLIDMISLYSGIVSQLLVHI